MRRPGIHVRLVLAAILLISATTFALSHMGGNIAYRFIQLRFEERMLFLARYLALNAELGILIDDQKMLRRLAENLLAEKDVVRVEIFNDRNEMLTEVTKGKGGKTSDVEVPVNLKKANSFPWGMVRKPESQVVGRVRIVYSTEGIDALLEVMRTRFLWLSVGLAAVAVGIFYFISRSLVAPVTRLVHASRQVASGDLALRVRPGTLPETRELAIAFNAMLDSLERNRQALEDAHLQMIRQEMLAQKGKFSLMIAHEFKNPLGIIKCSLDILKKDIECPENNLMIVYIEDEIRRLNQLIEDFLVFARPAVPNFREVDLSAVLRENVERFEIQLNGTPVKICTEIPSVACAGYADPDLLTRVIGNILKNAVEANENQGEILVRSFCREQTWVMEISDQGAGIAAENVQKIFEPFFTTRSRGTGLGLAFVAQVVAEHGGNITAENQETGGALFILELPLDRDLSDGETI